MKRSRTYVALALVYLFVPGAFDATENLVHLVAHGDLAHAGQHGDHRESGTEHDCSGPFHSCLCHSSLPMTVSPVGTRLAVPANRALRFPQQRLDQATSGYPDLLFRPPIG